MKIFILTQNENVYLPNALAKVCRELSSDISCIVSAPPMSTHGGKIHGFLKHFRLFGLGGTAIIGYRVIKARFKDFIAQPGMNGEFYSVKAVADFFRIPYYHVNKIKSRRFDEILEKRKSELLISISCPQIIGERIRSRFSAGCINVHGAPLPRYRGLMPAFWVLRNGETKTAVTVHSLADRLDNGDILRQRRVDINSDETWDSLVQKTKSAGAEALVEAVNEIKTGRAVYRPNPDSEATYFSFPSAQDRKAFLKKNRRFF